LLLELPGMEPIFFASPAEWRAWLETNHAHASEVIVGFHKKATGRPSMTWPEAVDEALCFGWIDGVRRSHGPEAYTNRFTPRRRRSNWSAINVKRVGELTAEGRMTPAGIAAFEARKDTGVYSYEQQRQAVLEPEQEARFRAVAAAWEWFSARPPSYRRAAIHWVTSAKRPETRERRLATLIADSAAGRPIKPLARP
jgi:uncharacterized protein YdeI (YjbR/CyaY-like superfamily)